MRTHRTGATRQRSKPEAVRNESSYGPPLFVANLESRPENDDGAIFHPARVLGRGAGPSINLGGDDFVAVDEVIDVARRRRHPGHVIDIVLNAAGITGE